MASSPLRTLAPRMPAPIKALLHERYEEIDPSQDIRPLLEFMGSAEAFHEFAHARDPFAVHLRGTWAILAAWGQSEDTCRCGLFHSAYTREGFYFRYFNICDESSRQDLRHVVGVGAEDQIYKYCVGESPWDVGEYNSMRGYPAPNAPPGKYVLGEPIDPAGYDVPSRVDPSVSVHYTAQDIANMSVVFVADLVEQINTVSTYGDIYHEISPGVLWPGTGLPGMGFAFYSRMLKSAAALLPTVPPVFNHCTDILDPRDELQARTLYWEGVQRDKKMPQNEQEELFRQATRLNPYIAEPHVMLSQCLFNRGAFELAAHHAIEAIDLFYQWGTNWDKRIQFPQWVGFARMALLRAKRRQEGLSGLPHRDLSALAQTSYDPVVTGRGKVTYLQDLLVEFGDHTEGEEDEVHAVDEVNVSGACNRSRL